MTATGILYPTHTCIWINHMNYVLGFPPSLFFFDGVDWLKSVVMRHLQSADAM